MKFFLDKNIPKSIMIFLQEEAHEVENARIIFPQETSDNKIAEYARKNNAILITRDLDFGNPIIYPNEAHYGLIIIRYPYYFIASQITSNFKQFLKSINPKELKGHITILELNKYRIKRI